MGSVERAHRDQKSKMGNKICSSKKSVDISNIEADGKNPIDVNDNPSEEKTAAFVKQMSVTEAGEGKKRINMQVEFHALLHDLKENGQLSQKNKLMTEIQMKTVGRKVGDAVDEIIKSELGQRKASVNEEVKQSTQGILKSQISCEITSDQLQRLVSVAAKKYSDELKETEEVLEDGFEATN